MSNRFTDYLLDPPGDFNPDGVFTPDLVGILDDNCNFPVDFSWEVLAYASGMNYNEWAFYKHTFFCLLAAMSDEDIQQLVIDPYKTKS